MRMTTILKALEPDDDDDDFQGFLNGFLSGFGGFGDARRFERLI